MHASVRTRACVRTYVRTYVRTLVGEDGDGGAEPARGLLLGEVRLQAGDQLVPVGQVAVHGVAHGLRGGWVDGWEGGMRG